MGTIIERVGHCVQDAEVAALPLPALVHLRNQERENDNAEQSDASALGATSPSSAEAPDAANDAGVSRVGTDSDPYVIEPMPTKGLHFQHVLLL